jgi:pimeloyl-ACP methyl ester carboxylesterase
MPTLQRGDASLYYEVYGSGYPVLVLAPGSLNSTIEAWHRSAWDPTKELADEYQVIAMDQRNAGQSRAPIGPADGWDTFLGDHLALLDHLGIERCHVMGACIGVSFALKIAQVQPQRVSAAVMQQPIGALKPREESMGFDNWVKDLVDHPEATPAVLKSYYNNIYGSFFVYSVTRDFVKLCQTPMLILPGSDAAHPHEVAEQLHDLAPNSEFIDDWKEGAGHEAAFARVREFLRGHTPTAVVA